MRLELDEKEWLIQVKEEMLSQQESYDPKTPCIFRVPSTMLKENEAAYIPEIVSLGPYHFGKPELRGMEKYKAQAAHKIQRRIPGNNFTTVVDKMMSMEHQIRSCYDKEIDFSSEVLSWIMARDASFLLEFFRNYSSPLQYQDSKVSTPQGQECFHPVFNPESDNSIVTTIFKDVMKLENQIPLFVLEEILAMETSCSKISAAEKLDLVIKMVLGNIYRPFDFYFFSRSPKRSHILEMYHHSCLGKDFFFEAQNSCSSWSPWPKPSEDVRLRLPSAVKLKNAGVKFRADAGGMDLVKFDKKTSVLSLPLIILNVESEAFIRNLIALEMCSPRYKLKKFTQYAQFMDDLIHNKGDVAVMRERGIFVGNLRSYPRLMSLWSCSNLSPSISQCSSIVKTRKNLHHFYAKKWKISRKIMWNEFWKAYGSKPWLVLGGIGATIILILTGLQVLCLFYPCTINRT